jgi:hypothetical protein
VWTPRRILLLLGGVLLFGGVYAVYARALGWLDGLPLLPARMLDRARGDFKMPPRPVSPTVLRLIEAFGPDCPERDDQAYPTKLEFRNGESSVVLAAGQTPVFKGRDEPGANRIVLAPFSLAAFGKPRPAHLRRPDEVAEVSTFHADKAVLEFDRPISNPKDMNEAKLVRMELVSEPEHALPDPRRGLVHITNNQRSADPNHALVVRTPGPVFYRDPKGTANPGDGPDVWTDAAVEIIDRQNLPRGFAVASPPTAPARGPDLRDAAAVADILAGRRLPPPTVAAVGMRLYFEPKKAPADKNAPPGKGSSGFGGVRRVELLEKVLVNLWVDASQNFVSDDKKPEPARAAPDRPAGPANPLVRPEPPPAAAAVLGGLVLGARVARQFNKALVQVETLGPFAYDVEKNTARFDVVPQADPNLLNDVQVTRVPPRGGQHKLFSQVLELEFEGPPTGPRPAEPAKAPDKKPAPDGPSFKRLHAWVYTPGRYLTVSAEAEQLEAYGQDLVYEQAANRTLLQGAPLYAVREQNVLTAGSPQRPGVLVLEPGPDRKTVATVRGRGRIELFDAASNANTTTATWQTSLTQTKETVNGEELDLLTFTDGARFEQLDADDKAPGGSKPPFWIEGKVIKLWIRPGKADPEKKAEPGGQPLPSRLQAIGDVSSHSADLDVEQAEHLNVMFHDVAPPPQPKPPEAGPMAPAAPTGPPMGPQPPAEQPKEEPKKPKPPMKLRARVVDTWVVRYPVEPRDAKKDPKAEGEPKADPAARASMRYELKSAQCDGQVVVHQDPADPEKPRGVDILAQTLIIEHTPEGSVMTVIGTEEKPGEVHHEATTIIGPRVVIDQLHNVAVVDGRGTLVMPASSDLGGTELKNPEVVVVHWRDKMEFSGAKKTAEFIGKVSARQGESWVVCHTLQVVFDRPVYFNRLQKAERKADPKDPGNPREKDSPKIDTVYCWPAPEDAADDRRESAVTFHEVRRDEAGRVAKVQLVEARELQLVARAIDERGDPYQQVRADGPGTVRIWQPGQKDLAAPPPSAGPRPGPTVRGPGGPASLVPGAPHPPDTEMKLTVVTFGGRMAVRDRGKVYQEAEFRDTVEVVNLPADDPGLKVERRLPPRSVLLRCDDRLTVSSYRRGEGPPEQAMAARGNAYVRTDEYEGWGEVVTSDGPTVTLHGNDPERPGPRKSLATIKSRFGGTEQSGEKIIYNRATGRYDAVNSSGGSIQAPPSPRPGPPGPKR